MTWLSGFEHRNLGPVGGAYDTRSNPKFGWHTWEGYSWSAAETAFARYPPHIAVNPKDKVRRQYVSLDRHAYAFAGSDSDDSYIIQVEVAGFAAATHTWPESYLRWLGEYVVKPIADAVGIPPVIVPMGFHGEREGMVLASERSPIRFRSTAALDAFSGHCGHQHMPAPDHHWDPGRLPIDRILAYAGGEEEFRMDDEAKAAFAALNRRLDEMEDKRLEPTTRRVRELTERIEQLEKGRFEPTTRRVRELHEKLVTD